MKTNTIKCSLAILIAGLSVNLVLSPISASSATLPKAPRASESPDLQLRLPFHVQALPYGTNSLPKLGLAIWGVMPNVLSDDNNTSGLFVAGPMISYDQRGSWVELMGGAKVNDDKYIDPFMNVRFLDRTFSRVNVGGDFEYFPQREQQRIYSIVYADTPISIGKQTWRIGVESENVVNFVQGKANSYGGGPRLQYILPIKSDHWSATITTSYQVRSDRDFVRIYIGVTWKPFGK